MNPIDLSSLHFLRPQWFLLVLPLAIILLSLWRKRLTSRSWRAVIDQQLLPHVLIGQHQHRGPWLMIAVGLAGILAMTALAGPVWEKLEQPVFRQQSALVILLDLSRSMDATDVRPSRLQRARLKLRDILSQRTEGQTALITYAAMAFVVTPLTSDTRTIAAQVPSLTTDLMPSQGSRPVRAIVRASELLRQAGAPGGDVLLVTDGIAATDSKELDNLDDAIRSLVNAGHHLHILGVGTDTGAPIPKQVGGFVTDNTGAIVIPKLNQATLRTLATQGQGLYRDMRIDDSDINAILGAINQGIDNPMSQKSEDLLSDQWREAGVWLLLPLILIVLPAFRRGVLGAVLVAALMLAPTSPVEAMEWSLLWQNADQRAKQALDKGEAARASELFQQPEWQATAQYRAGQYEKAAETLASIKGADAAYNRGNALTKMNKLSEALVAYNQALELSPDHADARYNAELIKQALKQQQDQTQDQDQAQNQEQKQDQQDDKSSSSKLGQQSDQPQDSTGKSSQDQQSGNQDNSQSTQRGTSDQQPQKQSGPEKSSLEHSSSEQSSNNDSQSAPSSAEDQAISQDETDNNPGKKESSSTLTDTNQDNLTAQQDASKQAQQQAITDSELQQATEQWLRRIPDDPGGLWRRKFLYQYQQQNQPQGDEEQAW